MKIVSKPIVEPELWQKLVKKNPALREALMNPNTDFMTKLLFDARFLEKKLGKELTYWSNSLVKIKAVLSEKKALDAKKLAKELSMKEAELGELLTYLKNLAEIKEEKGKYSLNENNPFSKLFL